MVCRLLASNYCGSPVVICSDDKALLDKCFAEVRSQVADKLGIEKQEVKIVNCAKDLDSPQKMMGLEKSKILLINDKYISKLVLLFFYNGPPSFLINLDLNERYCNFTKRLKFLKRDLTPAQLSMLQPEQIEFLLKQKCFYLLSESNIGSFKSLLKLKSIIYANNKSFNSSLNQNRNCIENNREEHLQPRYLADFLKQIGDEESSMSGSKQEFE